MKNIKELIKELLSLINKSELSNDQEARVKDLICYLSELRKDKEIPPEYLSCLNTILFSASVKLRTFGYNRLNNLQVTDVEKSPLALIKEQCIEKYYSTNTNFTLDYHQKIVLDSFEENNQRLFLSAPTSFGKTFLLKEIIYRHNKQYKNIVIILPTVALLMEVTEDLSNFFCAHNLPYKTHNSVYHDLEISECNAFILTPERFLRLLAIKPDLSVDFFFYDEIYKIDEDIATKDDECPDDIETNKSSKKINSHNHRAIAFRLALYYLLKLSHACYLAGPFIKLNSIGSGFSNMLKKYDIKPYEVSFEHTLKNKYDYHTSCLQIKTPFEESIISTHKNSKSDKLTYIVNHLNINTENPAIVFCLYPGYTENYAQKYCDNIGLKRSDQIDLFIDHISKNFNCRFGKKSSIDYWDFVYALRHGVGIHNGKFPKYFQREIMSIFNANQLSLLFCTSTIVEGINTNAKTVIVYNSPSGENEAGKRFLLLNINGRAGRYLRHFIGNIVYLDKKSLNIESARDISLDFKILNDTISLSDLDLENVEFKDISEKNCKKKTSLILDKTLLPDDVFEQNRLIERRKQEKILKTLRRKVQLFYGIETATIYQFIRNGYFDAILDIWAEVGEINQNQKLKIKMFSDNYARNGYLGVLQYSFKKYNNQKDKSDTQFVNEAYRTVFKDVKDIIEYQLPRILSLFESLINQAFKLSGYELTHPLDLSHIIRYFEIGSTTLLGTDMVEKGVPVITVRKIETKKLQGDSLIEQQQFFLKQKSEYQKTLFLDKYELSQLEKYCNSLR